MGKTIAEKIIAEKAGVTEVSAGDVVWVNVDKAMMDDILGPRVQIAEQMEMLKMPILYRDRVVVISDHYTPPANTRQADIVKFTRIGPETTASVIIMNLKGHATRSWLKKGMFFRVL